MCILYRFLARSTLSFTESRKYCPGKALGRNFKLCLMSLISPSYANYSRSCSILAFLSSSTHPLFFPFILSRLYPFVSFSSSSSSFSFSVSSPFPLTIVFFHLTLLFFVSPTYFLVSCICSVSHIAFVYHRPYCSCAFFLCFLRPAFPCVKYCFCF
jgi:hypothetical protein